MLLPRLDAVRRSLVILWAGGLTLVAIGWAVGVGPLRLSLFVATVVVELAAVVVAFAGRARLSREDPGRRAWTWIGAGLGLRLLAELRLATLYLDAVPGFISGDDRLWAVYFFGLRYLYTLADLALLTGLLAIRRDLLSTGLGFHLRPRDALLLVVLPPLPVTVYLLQSVFLTAPVDAGLHSFRLVSATVGAVVSGVCVVLASPALQMGGGAWAWIWGAAAAAGIARALAFAFAAIAPTWADAIFIEQGLLWTFACFWLLATTLHLRLVTPELRTGSR
ncbi:MAG: hypothetical protein IPO88_29840 [Nannocystis sp.]|uniref:hypothetical protein n=1 Tax=Nannocystis sp. TaxID=1962667 RepID=UPI0024267C22|nr:hypothetical protein [Nannocystis sp.]MBK9757635.1 hypothetical protein [Nannocystis sp.]